METARPLARRAELTSEQQEEIREAFELFDSDGGGSVDRRDLRVLLRALGHDVRREHVTKILTGLGVNPKKDSGKIQFKEFLALVANLMNEKEIKEEMIRAFNLFDVDGTNKITIDNLQDVANQLGENISRNELEEMIQEADLSGDGTVSAAEFIRIMKKTELW